MTEDEESIGQDYDNFDFVLFLSVKIGPDSPKKDKVKQNLLKHLCFKNTRKERVKKLLFFPLSARWVRHNQV